MILIGPIYIEIVQKGLDRCECTLGLLGGTGEEDPPLSTALDSDVDREAIAVDVDPVPCSTCGSQAPSHVTRWVVDLGQTFTWAEAHALSDFPCLDFAAQRIGLDTAHTEREREGVKNGSRFGPARIQQLLRGADANLPVVVTLFWLQGLVWSE